MLNAKSKNDIDQPKILNCCICNKQSKHPQKLPCCHAIACKSCLKEWLETQNCCPNCSISFQKSKSKSLCKTHNKKLEYYCKTCNEYLCSDCLLEQIQLQSSKHTNHEIIKTTEMETTSREELETYLKSLKSFSEELQTSIDSLKKEKNELPSKKVDIEYQSRVNFDNLKKEVDSLYDKSQSNYKSITNSLQQQISQFQTILEESELIIKSSDTKVVPMAEGNIDKLKEISDQISPILPDPPSTHFLDKLKPPIESMKVRIPDFQTLVNNIRENLVETDYIFSEEKTFFGCVWRAKIFPNGTLAGKGTHLGLYVELLKGSQLPASFLYQYEIEATNNTAKSICRKFESEFHPMDSWGWNKVLPIDSIIENYLDENGALTLIISVSPSTYLYAIAQRKNEYAKISKEYKKLKAAYATKLKQASPPPNEIAEDPNEGQA